MARVFRLIKSESAHRLEEKINKIMQEDGGRHIVTVNSVATAPDGTYLAAVTVESLHKQAFNHLPGEAPEQE